MDGHLHIRQLVGHGRGPLDFDVAVGACTILSGASGTGKSLILRMIADLIPNTGEVRIGKSPRESLSGPAWRREVVYVAAESGWWADDVRSHFDVRGSSQLESQLGSLLERLHLRGDILDAQVTHLSTGERQRLALLRAIVLGPRFLLLDEPTSGLDLDSTLAVEALLKDLMAEGTGLLVVTHNPQQIARLQGKHLHLCANGLEVLCA
ncbi:ATP-binding cassette domain-containing protein [Cupriavidus pauculus]|uniref:ABC transporter ATP-binding protein n=1 Tax=Cupriavidus pauculus TaxID=82633 RepID=UPI001EE23CE7|nr:ATP-binding cassette domain-containing protein [Cupriavidus pauculus]GJG98406.1 ATP-binding cassette domain-containing protein [Cupriavidus pauculus]